MATLVNCDSGNASDPKTPPDPVSPGAKDPATLAASQPRARRLSNQELGNTVFALTGVRPAALSQLPPDQRTFVFDRMAGAQAISPIYLDAFTAVARDIHKSLIATQRLDDLAAACTDDILPPAVPSTRTRLAGVALIGEPDWAQCPTSCALGPPAAADARYILYASPGQAAVSTPFEVPADGRYTITLSIKALESLTARLLVDKVAITSLPVSGSGAVELKTTQRLTAGARDIRFDFSTNNSRLDILALTIEGPVDEINQPTKRRACAQALVDNLAPRAYRRPIVDAESKRLLAVYDAGIAVGSFNEASRMLFEAMFTSPHFLYLVEVGTPDAASPDRYRLGDWELASRLSYSLCEGPPDDALRAAAAAGQVHTKEQIHAQAERLLAAPCGRETVARFYRQWLRLEQLAGLARDPMVYPDFVAATMPPAMLREADRFLAELTWNENARVADLYTADHTWVDATSAALYGLALKPPGDTQTRVGLPPERRGLLTLPGILAVTSKFSQTSPVHRGVFVTRSLLCRTLSNPPSNVNTTPPALDPSLTTRQRWAAHSASPACASCHSRLDPIGFSLESFDAVGRYRTEEYGKPIDSNGGLPDLGAKDGTLAGAAPLANLVGASKEAVDCFSRQWFRFATARIEQEGTIDDSTLSAIRGPDGSAGPIRASLLAYVDSEAFTLRVVPKELAAP